LVCRLASIGDAKTLMNPTAIDEGSSRLETDLQRSQIEDKHGVSEEELHISRRTFCNELWLTSTGIMLGARAVAGETATAQESVIAYPPVPTSSEPTFKGAYLK
jgi:hypothetical protein